jgi:hypothetical protein
MSKCDLINKSYLVTLNQRVQGSSPCAPTKTLKRSVDYRASEDCQERPGFVSAPGPQITWPATALGWLTMRVPIEYSHRLPVCF